MAEPKRHPIAILALDLDGTLTDSNKKISAGNREALEKAEEKGIRVALTSGRAMLGIRKLAKELSLSERGGFVISCNGAEIVDCEAGRIIFQESLPEGFARRANTLIRDMGLHALSYDSTHIYAEKPDGKYVQWESFCTGTPITGVKDLADAFPLTPPPKLLVADEPELLQEAYPALAEALSDEADLFFSDTYFLEIMPKGVNKAFGLQKLADVLGVGPEQVMAVGDGFNDITMLQYAGISVAMGNAYDEVKQAARYVTASNDEDGVALAIERFILGQ